MAFRREIPCFFFKLVFRSISQITGPSMTSSARTENGLSTVLRNDLIGCDIQRNCARFIYPGHPSNVISISLNLCLPPSSKIAPHSARCIFDIQTTQFSTWHKWISLGIHQLLFKRKCSSNFFQRVNIRIFKRMMMTVAMMTTTTMRKKKMYFPYFGWNHSYVHSIHNISLLLRICEINIFFQIVPHQLFR